MPDFGGLEQSVDFDAPTAGSLEFGPMLRRDPTLMRRSTELVQPRDYGFGTTVAGAAAFAIPDLVDTVVSSIPGLSRATGLQRGDFNEKVLQAIDAPGLTQFYRDRHGAIEVASGVGGIVLSEVVTRGLLRGAGAFSNALEKVPYAKRIMALDSEYKRALAAVRQIDTALAQKGVIGAAQFVEKARVSDRILSPTGEIIEQSVVLSRAAAANKARRLGTTKEALRFGASELTFAVMMNENSFLFDDEMAVNLMYGALGVGIGGVVGTVGANYAMRKFANSDRMQRLYARAFDVTEQESARLFSAGINKVLDTKLDDAIAFSMLGHFTDKASSFMMSARARPREGIDASTHLQMTNQFEAMAHRETQKVTVKGIPGVPATSFTLDAPGFGNAVKDVMHRDPGALLFTEAMGGIGEGQTFDSVIAAFRQTLDKRKKQIEDLLQPNAQMLRGLTPKQTEELQRELRAIEFAERTTPLAIIDGEVTTLSHAQAYDGWVEPVLKIDSTPDFFTVESFSAEGKAHKIGLDSDGVIYYKDNQNLTNQDLLEMDYFDMLRLYRAGSELVKFYASPQSKQVFRMPDNPTWFHLDLAEEIIRVTGDESKVIWGNNLSRDTAQVESFAQKFDAIQLVRDPVKAIELQIESFTKELNKLLSETDIDKVRKSGTAKNMTDEELRDLVWRKLNSPKFTKQRQDLTDEINFLEAKKATLTPRVTRVLQEINKVFEARKHLFPAIKNSSLSSQKSRVIQHFMHELSEDAKEFLINKRAFDQETGEYLSIATHGPQGFRESHIINLYEEARLIDEAESLERAAQLPAQLRVRLNLPRVTAEQAGRFGTPENPLVQMMMSTGAVTSDDIRQLSAHDLRRYLDEAATIADYGIYDQMQMKDVSLSGNSFRFMTDVTGKPTKPILLLKRPVEPDEWTSANLAERLAQRKIFVAKNLIGEQSDGITRELTQRLISSPDFEIAAKASSLGDIQMQSATPGLGNAAPTSVRGTLASSVSTTEWQHRDNPIMLAATRLREHSERMMRGFMRKAFEESMGETLAVLNGPRNEGSRILLNQFHSFAGGWEIAPGHVTKVENGKKLHAFTLRDTESNRWRWKQEFNEEFTPGQLLVNSDKQIIYLDDLALDVQTRFNLLTDIQLSLHNSVRKAIGLKEAGRLDWYVPPPEVEGKFIGYTFDVNNNIIPGGTIIADTETEFNRQLSKLRENPESSLNRDGSKFMTLKQIKDHADLWDRVQMEMMNPGRTPLVGFRARQGKNAGAFIDLSAFETSMNVVRDGMLDHSRNIVHTLMKDSLDAAKARAEVATSSVQTNRGTREDNLRARSIYDYYVQEITGASPRQSEKSWVGSIMKPIEAKANRALEAATPRARSAIAAANDYLKQANFFRLTDREKSAFEQLTKDLGEAMPFKSVSELMEAKGYGGRPPNIDKIAGDLSRFQATWILRMFETMHATLNLAGMVNATPAVVRHLSMRPGETQVDYAARIGHSAQIFNIPESGASFGVLDMGKLMLKGFQRAWSKDADADYARLTMKGFTTQEVAEFQKAFNAAELRTGWDLFMNGDPRASNKFAQKGLVGWISVLSDKSEDFSRTWGTFMGLELGQALGIRNVDALDNFAHDIANKMIANYSPHNRIEWFQGALGAPIGLFQSFIWAYYQRLFRYIETGDGAALGAQLATQAGIFGLHTVPGYSQLTQLEQSVSDGKSTPTDAIRNRFGNETGDILFAGTLGSIPTLFGQEALDLASRGDVEFRMPGLGTSIPIVTISKKFYEGVAAGIDLFSRNNPEITTQRIGEILANAIPNRPLAGLIEQTLAGGKPTDIRGQLQFHVNDAMETAYRVMGTRSARQTQELAAFYANKQAQEISASQKETLRKNTRAMIRAGANPQDLEKVFETYVAQGGDPRHYKRWLREQFEAALTPRAQRQLAESLRNPAREAEARRLMNARVKLYDEENEPEYEVTQPEDGNLSFDF